MTESDTEKNGQIARMVECQTEIDGQKDMSKMKTMRAESQTDRHTEGHMDRHADRQAERQTSGQPCGGSESEGSQREEEGDGERERRGDRTSEAGQLRILSRPAK